MSWETHEDNLSMSLVSWNKNKNKKKKKIPSRGGSATVDLNLGHIYGGESNFPWKVITSQWRETHLGESKISTKPPAHCRIKRTFFFSIHFTWIQAPRKEVSILPILASSSRNVALKPKCRKKNIVEAAAKNRPEITINSVGVHWRNGKK